ncbi:MAG: beta-ketoacyl-[acyl-carrier-protein] synthase family protein [Bacteroidota bacterium]
MNRVFVTGLGVITSVGDTVDANRTALKEGICGITTLEQFPSKYAGRLPVGEIKIANQLFKEKLKVRESGVTRTTLLALHAFQEAIHDSKLSQTQLSSQDTALIGATTVGGMCLTDELYHDANRDSEGAEYLSSYDAASVNAYLQQRYRLNGIINTLNTACSSSANALMFGARLIKHGLAKRAIVGGVDSLAKFTINGFNALHILSSTICRPFDADRNGLNLGEGAGFLVLEREEDAAGKRVYAELSGYCNANDAFHPSSLSENGDGPYLAMKGALAVAKLSANQIGFVNAHGTGTENNDEVESRAMLRIFEQMPAFASTKGNIGHTLGGASAIEAVYSLLNLVYQEVYPGLNFENPMATTGLSPIQTFTSKPLTHVMSNSFGFGGNCSSLIFSKV